MSKRGKELLKKLLEILENAVKEIGLDKSVVYWSADYNKIDNAHFDQDFALSIIDKIIQQLQELQNKEESTSKQPQKKIKIDQDSLSRTNNPHDHQNNKESDDVQAPGDVDWTLVQVTADKSEIDRRISAFMQQKQNEVNLVNIREFCNIVDNNHENVTRVGNTGTSDEAQTLSHVTDNTKLPGNLKGTCSEPSVTERLYNIEHHLGFTPGKPVPLDVYERIRDLESRILHLESLSPEYFDKSNVCQTAWSQSNSSNNSLESMSLSTIDKRISALKSMLLSKTR